MCHKLQTRQNQWELQERPRIGVGSNPKDGVAIESVLHDRTIVFDRDLRGVAYLSAFISNASMKWA